MENWLWRRKHRNNVKVARVTKATSWVGQTNRLLVVACQARAAGVYEAYYIVPSVPN